MNKVIIGLVAAVVILITALIVLNQQLTPQNEAAQSDSSSAQSLPKLPENISQKETADADVSLPQNRNTLPPLPDSLGSPNAAPSVSGTITPVQDTTTEPSLTEPSTNEAANSSVSGVVVLNESTPEPEPTPSPTVQTEESVQAQTSPEPELEPEVADITPPAPTPPVSKVTPTEPERDETPIVQAPKVQEPVRPVVKEQPKPAPKHEKKVQPKEQRIIVYSRENGATVRILGTHTITYKKMVLVEPDRVVVDLDGDWTLKVPGIPPNVLVTNVRLGKFENRTRVVVDLNTKPRKHSIILSSDKRRLDIRVDK